VGNPLCLYPLLDHIKTKLKPIPYAKEHVFLVSGAFATGEEFAKSSCNSGKALPPLPFESNLVENNLLS
jgi:hypothetical protein